MGELITKFIIGGSCVAGVTLLVQKGFPEYAGIIMTFPIITIVSLLAVSEDSVITLSKAGIIGLVSAMVFLFIFMASYRVFLNRYISLASSSVIWVLLIVSYFYIRGNKI